MVQNFADIAEIFLGWGEAYPKADIVNFLVSTTGDKKDVWNNKSDSIYWSYHRAVSQKGFKAYGSDPNNMDAVINYVTSDTGLPRNDVYRYLLSLWTMANMGKLETKYWNPAAGTAQYGTNQAAAAIKDFISPVTQAAASPAKNLMTGILIAGGLTAIGIFASKEFIKQKAKGGRK